MQESKCCDACGRQLFRRPRDSNSQWESRKYCSIGCSNRSSIPTPLHIRFWENVIKGAPGECWKWIGTTNQHGYGQLTMPYGQSPMKAHRLSWEIHNGPIPHGMGVLHKCDNPNCTNPEHLVPGDQKENSRQASERGRLNPKSLHNLRPGAKGFHGAGPKTRGEITNGQ